MTQAFARVGVYMTHISMAHFLLLLLLWWLFLSHSHKLGCPQNLRGETLCKTSYLQWQDIGIIQNYISKMASKMG